MKNYIIILFASLGVYPQLAKAQKSEQYKNITTVTYIAGIDDSNSQKAGNTFSLRNTSSWRVTNHFFMGLGMGIESYQINNGSIINEHYNLTPVFVDARYRFNENLPGLQFFASPGYSVGFLRNSNKGFTAMSGAGYEFNAGKNSSLIGTVSYNYQQIESKFGSVDLSGLGLGFSIVF